MEVDVVLAIFKEMLDNSQASEVNFNSNVGIGEVYNDELGVSIIIVWSQTIYTLTFRKYLKNFNVSILRIEQFSKKFPISLEVANNLMSQIEAKYISFQNDRDKLELEEKRVCDNYLYDWYNKIIDKKIDNIMYD